MPTQIIPGPGTTPLVLGYMEAGTMIAMVLFGMSTVQVYMYFSGRAGDKKIIRAVVIIIWLLEFAHTFLTGMAIFTSTVTHSSWNTNLRMNLVSGLIGILISTISQIFFSYRLWQISRSKYLPGFCVFLSFSKITIFYVVVVHDLVAQSRGPVYQTLITVSGVLSWSDDLLVASGLAWRIWTRKKEGEFRAGTFVDRILLWCLETNLLTCTSATLAFIFSHATAWLKRSYVHLPLALITCRLYSMCIFASLIARNRLGEETQLNHFDPDLATGSSYNPNAPPTELAFITSPQ